MTAKVARPFVPVAFRMRPWLAAGLALLAGPAVAQQSTHAADAMRPGRIFRDCPDCPEMVIVPAGAFTMGSYEYEQETPLHKVTIARPFGGEGTRQGGAPGPARSNSPETPCGSTSAIRLLLTQLLAC